MTFLIDTPRGKQKTKRFSRRMLKGSPGHIKTIKVKQYVRR